MSRREARANRCLIFNLGATMGKIVETLQELGISGESFVYLNYEDRASVWHISDDYYKQKQPKCWPPCWPHAG